LNQDNVFQLDITMQDVEVMQIVEGRHQLHRNTLHHGVTELEVAGEVEQRSPLADLSDNVEKLLVLVHLIEFDNVGVV
jgi:hypothetical protein